MPTPNLSQLISGQGLAQLQAGSNGWMFGNEPVTFSADGRNWVVENIGDENTGPQFIAYDPSDKEGSGALVFDGGGNFVKQQAWREANTSPLLPLAAALGMYFGLPALMGEGAGAAGAVGGIGELGAFEGTGLTFGGAEGALGAGALGAGGIAPSVALTPVEIAAGSSTVAPVVAEGGAALGGMGAMGAGAANLPGAAEMGLASVGGAGAGAGGWLSSLGISPSMLGIGASLLGGALGGKGQQASQSTSSSVNPQMSQAMFGDLVPRVQGLLNAQMPGVTAAGQKMAGVGMGLLDTQSPTTAQNPYLAGMADDIGRRTQDLLGQNNMAIQGNAVASGGLGGSRQGVAQGIAAGKAADTLQGNLANLYGQQYQFDQTNYLNKLGMGANLTNTGLGLPWQPLKSAASIYAPLAESTKTVNSTSSQGGGAMGVLGGALAGAQLGKNFGWW